MNFSRSLTEIAIRILLGAFEGVVLGVAASVLVRQYSSVESGHGAASRCNRCSRQATLWELLPFGPVVVDHSRCRACSGRLSLFDPCIELGCGVLCALVAARVSSIWEVPAFSVLIAGLVTLSIVDLDCRRLPARIVYGTGVVTGALLFGAAGALGDWGDLNRAVFGALVTFLGFAALSLVYPKGLGFGDVRLAGLCGGILGWLGYGDIILGFLVASGVGTIAAVAAMSRRGVGATIPFGPCLAIGVVTAVVVGTVIV